MKALIGKLMSPLLAYSGVYARGWRSAGDATPRVLVLAYHSVAPAGPPSGGSRFGVENGLPLDVLESQIRFALRHFEPVPASQLVEANRPLPSLAFTLTFDDGYADNLSMAAPLLEELQVPATVFITTDYVGTERLFWWEQLGEILRRTRERELEVQQLAPELLQVWPVPARLPLLGHSDREVAHWQLSMALMRTRHSSIEQILGRLAQGLATSLPAEGRRTPLLDWDGVKELWRRGFEIGAHGATHANLGLANEAELREETEGSVRRIETELGERPVSFAYPYGGAEHRSPAAVAAVREAGCRLAFTTELGVASTEGDPFALPRVGFTRGSRIVCAYQTDRAFRASGA